MGSGDRLRRTEAYSRQDRLRASTRCAVCASQAGHVMSRMAGLFYPAKDLIVVSVVSQAGQTRITRAQSSSTNTGAPSEPGMNVCQQTLQQSDGRFTRCGMRHQRADVISPLQSPEVPSMTMGSRSIPRGCSTEKLGKTPRGRRCLSTAPADRLGIGQDRFRRRTRPTLNTPRPVRERAVGSGTAVTVKLSRLNPLPAV